MRKFLLIVFLSIGFVACEEQELFIPSQKEEIEIPEIQEVEEDRRAVCFFLPEKMPYYEYGYDSLFKVISERLPRFKTHLIGRAFISFVVEKNGDVSNMEVVRGFGSPYDEQILESLIPMPKFIPGSQNGQPVRSRMIIPVRYE